MRWEIMSTRISQITGHLFLSSAGAISHNRLHTLGITQIVNCTIEIPSVVMPGVETVRIQLDDVPASRLEVFFDKCADRIHQVHGYGGKTLVHCVAGVSRSASLCIAYLMKYHRMSLRQAFYHVRNCRHIINPNIGFWRQLIDYERRLYGQATVKIVSSNLGHVPDVYIEKKKPMAYFPSL